MKKLLLVLLTVFSFNAIHAEIAWELSSDGTLTISGTDMPNYSETNPVPWQSSNVREIVIEDGVTNIGDQAFRSCMSVTSVTIPKSVTSIGMMAFNWCGMTMIEIPSSVTEIKEGAFSCCTNLTSITIPKSVTSIGELAFDCCHSLSSIVVEDGNTKYDSRNSCNAIIETNSNTLIQGCKNTVIPNNVTSIGNDAFYCCSDITSIDIPNSVTSIGDRAFYVCDKLTSVVIPNSVTSIGEEAFYYCNAFESIVLPESVKRVGKKAFRTCNNLTNLTISNSEMSIADDAFEECWMLLNVTILSKNPPAFTNVTFPSYTTFHVPAGSKAAYETAEFWKNFNIVEDVTTGIDSVAAPAMISDDKIFSISGQRLDKAAKGVNIINGKKVLVK